jgi:hypothetical protein
MSHSVQFVLRLIAGLLVAGLIAPLTLQLPEAWQGPALLGVLTVLCVTTAFTIGRQRRAP